MIKVSVIIPVYNGEKYLKQCLDSVCNQTLKEIEIICVDDGSTDSSFQILEEYQQKDERIQLFQQENQYAGAARNLGKKHATGEYLMFWDCDDFFELDALEKMYTRAADLQVDICVCGGNKYFNDTQKVAPNASNYLNTKYISREVFNRTTDEDYILNFTNAVPWNKMFRRQFIEEIDLDFQPIRNGNDIYFTQCAIVLAERITIVNEGLINYRINNEESLTGTLSKSPLVPLGAWIGVEEKLSGLNVLPEKSYVNKVIGAITALLRNIKEVNAFAETVEFLKNGTLEKLHIREQEEEFYYVKWHYEFVKHLINDSIEGFGAYLRHQTYTQLTERNAEKAIQNVRIKMQKQEIKALSAELKQTNAKRKSTETELEKKEKELAKKEKELAKAEKNLEKAHKELEKANKELEKAEKNVQKVERNLEKANKELDKIRNSWSYKIGRAIVWIPSKIKNIFTGKR